jgi:hypothetical protein
VAARLAAFVLALAALVAGCGGTPPGQRPSHFDLGPSRACLQEQPNVKVSTTDLDFVASTALGGGMRVTLPDNFVVLAFGEDTAEADRIEQAYRNFAGEDIPIDDVLRRDQNVVMVWNAPPSAEDEGLVLGCLRAAE